MSRCRFRGSTVPIVMNLGFAGGSETTTTEAVGSGSSDDPVQHPPSARSAIRNPLRTASDMNATFVCAREGVQ